MNRLIRSTMETLLVVGAVVGAANALAAPTDSALEKCSDPRVDRTACLRETRARHRQHHDQGQCAGRRKDSSYGNPNTCARKLKRCAKRQWRV